MEVEGKSHHFICLPHGCPVGKPCQKKGASSAQFLIRLLVFSTLPVKICALTLYLLW